MVLACLDGAFRAAQGSLIFRPAARSLWIGQLLHYECRGRRRAAIGIVRIVHGAIPAYGVVGALRSDCTRSGSVLRKCSVREAVERGVDTVSLAVARNFLSNAWRESGATRPQDMLSSLNRDNSSTILNRHILIFGPSWSPQTLGLRGGVVTQSGELYGSERGLSARGHEKRCRALIFGGTDSVQIMRGRDRSLTLFSSLCATPSGARSLWGTIGADCMGSGGKVHRHSMLRMVKGMRGRGARGYASPSGGGHSWGSGWMYVLYFLAGVTIVGWTLQVCSWVRIYARWEFW